MDMKLQRSSDSFCINKKEVEINSIINVKVPLGLERRRALTGPWVPKTFAESRWLMGYQGKKLAILAFLWCSSKTIFSELKVLVPCLYVLISLSQHPRTGWLDVYSLSFSFVWIFSSDYHSASTDGFASVCDWCFPYAEFSDWLLAVEQPCWWPPPNVFHLRQYLNTTKEFHPGRSPVKSMLW